MEKSLLDELSDELKADYRKRHPKENKELGEVLKEDIDKLLAMAKEDLLKPGNENLSFKIGGRNGVELTKEALLNDPQLSDEEIKKLLNSTFYDLNKIFNYYMDDTAENIAFYSVWLIGTYFHDQFYSYPYLFLNAMRGSGKSRLLKLISFLGDGKYTSSITEPIIFRTQGLLCVDELESIGGKDKSALRELLNASYKKGMTIMRTIKKKDISGDNMQIEEFEPYRPIAMANIWGMDEVLGDRCITRILEKSDNPIKTKRNENFESNPLLNSVRSNLELCRVCSVVKNSKSSNLGTLDPIKAKCRVCSVVLEKRQQLWNKFIDSYVDTTNYINYINYTNYTNYIFSPEELEFYNKINDSGIFGRNLELFLPIFIIADMVGKEVFESILEIAKKMNEEKRENELNESADVMVYEFVSNRESSIEFIPVKDLFWEFKNFSQIDAEWFNDRWFGKALKRLNLIISKRRKTKGMEVILNITKAKEKLKIFKN